MWDVTWTDPDKELVGEHRARKDKDGSEKNKNPSRHSVSTTSSKGSSQSALSRLRAKATRQSSASKEPTTRDSSALLRFTTPEAPSKNLCSIEMSGGLVDSSIGHSMPSAPRLATQHSASDATVSANGHSMVSPTSNNERCKLYAESYAFISLPHPSEHDVANSPFAAFSSTITSAPSELDDVFSPEAKGTERIDDLEKRYNYQRPFGRFVLDGTRRPSDLQSPVRQSFNFSHGFSQQSPTRLYAARYTMTNGDNRVNPIPPARSPLRPATQKSHDTKSINNASSWRRPRDWSLPALASLPNQESTETVSGYESISSSELAKQVEDMARAPPAVALAKLKEPYNNSMSLEDHQKLNDEKERWMLSALQHLDRNWQQPVKDTTRGASEVESTEQQKQKLLAFYEPQFSARYLAAFWPNKEVHHLSDRPLSFKAAPNLRAIFKPSICTPFPELTGTFDTVHSMLLPALCDGTEILTVLNSINKCLKPGGSLNLIIIDSIPHVDAFGANMRAWFMKNIVLNLQHQSRVLNPSLNFPELLSKASLRGPGSILTTTQFYANPQNIDRHPGSHDGAPKRAREDKQIRAELRSMAGRMLWKEVWGQFVTSDTWWWEEADCMQECLELGTFWEYHSVQAVKAD